MKITKADREALRLELSQKGYEPADIARVMGARYRLRPRLAFRWAHGMTLQAVAAVWNQQDASGRAAMTTQRVSDYERWPDGGKRPTIYVLLRLAKIYGTTPERLLDERDYAALSEQQLFEVVELCRNHADADKKEPLPRSDVFRDDKTQRSEKELEVVPHSFSAETLGGLWATSYQFHWKGETRHHADITRITPQSSRRLTAKNYPPDPRTEGQVPAFHNEIEAQLVNRHVMGHWRNLSDTRYFGSVHLALLVGEAAMDGYYTSFLSDIEVDAMRWKWVRLDSATLSGVDLGGLVLKEPELIYDALEESAAPVALSAVIKDAV